MSTDTTLRIAIQKNGRITQETLSLLQRAGVLLPPITRSLCTRANNFPLEILYLRSKDIPEIIRDDCSDIGIVGQNILEESGFKEDLYEVERLGFGKCHLCLAAPKNGSISAPQDFSGKAVATSHLKITEQYFRSKGISAELIPMSGSVEIAPSLNIADGICDLVSTGSTLRANHLTEIASIFSSQAILVSRKNLSPLKQEILEAFLLRIHSVINARGMKSVVLNAPDSVLEEIENILPGLESPTVTPLKKKGWIAVHSVLREDEEFWERVSQLKKIGATGILVSPIERIIF